MSSAVPARPSGVWATKVFASSGLLARVAAFNGVSMKPGPIALTRTPSLPSSAASARVKPSTPCFAAVEAGGRGGAAGTTDWGEPEYVVRPLASAHGAQETW